jgi:hypothetical protein
VACLVVTALAFYTNSHYLSLSAALSGSRTSAGPSFSAPPSSSTAAPSPTTPASPGDLPPTSGSQQPGIRLVATVLAKGVLQVRETVRLAAPVTQACFAGERPNARVNRTLPLRAAPAQVQLDLQAAARESRR